MIICVKDSKGKYMFNTSLIKYISYVKEDVDKVDLEKEVYRLSISTVDKEVELSYASDEDRLSAYNYMYRQLGELKDTFIESYDHYGKYLFNYKMISRIVVDKGEATDPTESGTTYKMIISTKSGELYEINSNEVDKAEKIHGEIKICRIICDKSVNDESDKDTTNSLDCPFSMLLVFVEEDMYRLDFNTYQDMSDAYDNMKRQFSDLKEGVILSD